MIYDIAYSRRGTRDKCPGTEPFFIECCSHLFAPFCLLREFARQIAASGINVVLVARRESLLDEVGQGLAKDFSVRYRNVVTHSATSARVGISSRSVNR